MIDSVIVGALDENSYIICNDNSNDCILIDPGSEPEKIEELCSKYGKTPKYILITHGHFDHIGAAKHFQDKGAEVFVHEDDAKRLEYDRMAVMFGFQVEWLKADHLLKDNDELDLLGYHIRVVHTPGHSKGAVMYIFDSEKAIFVGDTIFFRSYGRYDFPEGSFDELKDSFRKIYNIPSIDDYTVYTGHGISTTIGDEKLYNPINTSL